MATEVIHENIRIISMDREDAANVIGLLAAQLAGTTLQGNQSGATPTINIVENGVIKYRLVLVVQEKP